MHRQPNPRTRKRHVIAAIVLACAAASAPNTSARASEPAAYDAMPERVAAAEWIGVADLVEMPVRRSANDHRLVTDYRFSAMRTLFGQLPSADLVLSEEGGGLDGEAPPFVLGARYVLFVRPGSGGSTIVGGAQGVYRLSIDGRAMALGGEREILDGGDLLAEIDRLVAARKGPERTAPTQSATAARGGAGH
jgi:hypothetical protein